MKVNVKLTPVISFEVTREDGEKLGTFIQTSEWNGMVQLSNGPGKTLIVESPNQGFLADLFGGSGEPKLVPVIKASPDVINQFDPT